MNEMDSSGEKASTTSLFKLTSVLLPNIPQSPVSLPLSPLYQICQLCQTITIMPCVASIQVCWVFPIAHISYIV